MHKGDVLAQLDPTFAGSDMQSAKGDVQTYQAQVDELTAELNRTPYQPKTANYATAVQAALYGERMAQYRCADGGLQPEDRRAAGPARPGAGRHAGLPDAADSSRSQLEDIRVKLERMQVGSAIDRIAAQDQRTEMRTPARERGRDLAAGAGEHQGDGPGARDLRQAVVGADQRQPHGCAEEPQREPAEPEQGGAAPADRGDAGAGGRHRARGRPRARSARSCRRATSSWS